MEPGIAIHELNHLAIGRAKETTIATTFETVIEIATKKEIEIVTAIVRKIETETGISGTEIAIGISGTEIAKETGTEIMIVPDTAMTVTTTVALAHDNDIDLGPGRDDTIRVIHGT